MEAITASVKPIGQIASIDSTQEETDKLSCESLEIERATSWKLTAL